jgi:hypothetical protein
MIEYKKRQETIMQILARNLPGYKYNQDVPSGYMSWLDYWQKKRGLVAGTCRCCGKHCNDLVGGHVEAIGYTGVYIVPLCASCNSSENRKSFYVNDQDFVKVLR